MAQKTETLSYDINKFLKYSDKFSTISKDLLPYCYNNKEFNYPNIAQYVEHMKLISDNVTKGINMNDVLFKNDVKYLINTISKKNYNDVLNKLKVLNFSTRENVEFLAHELIVNSMRCPYGIKGIHKEREKELEMEKTKTMSLSEIFSDVIRYFCLNVTKENNNGIAFNEELFKLCRKFFMDFVNLTKSMDQNNENTSDNYKGFMTLMGFIYENNLVPFNVIMDCVDSIKRTIFCSKITKKTEQIKNNVTEQHQKMFGYKKNFNNELFDYIVYFDTDVENMGLCDEDNAKVCYRNATECVNFYKGYENLSHHYISSMNNKIFDFTKNIKHYNSIINDIEKKDTKVINQLILAEDLEDTPEKYEENVNFLVKKYSDYLENLKLKITKQTEFLELFMKSHEEIATLNGIFKVTHNTNKNQFVPPLKPYIMILHEEINQHLIKCHKSITNIPK